MTTSGRGLDRLTIVSIRVRSRERTIGSDNRRRRCRTFQSASALASGRYHARDLLRLLRTAVSIRVRSRERTISSRCIGSAELTRFQSASALASGRCARLPVSLLPYSMFQSASALASGRSARKSLPRSLLRRFNPRPLSRADDAGLSRESSPCYIEFQSASALASGRFTTQRRRSRHDRVSIRVRSRERTIDCNMFASQPLADMFQSASALASGRSVAESGTDAATSCFNPRPLSRADDAKQSDG